MTVTLAYHRSGRGAPLVLLHGFPLDRTFWSPMLPFLREHFDCIVPDLRGFGQSPAIALGYSLDDMAADVAALLHALEIPAAFLAGHSMGGYIALAFARRFGEKLRGLGLLGTQAAPDTPERRQIRYETIEQVRREGVTPVLGMAEKLTAAAHHAPTLREIIARQNPTAVMGALQAMAERPDSLSTLAALSVPVVIVHGLQDSLVPVERAREMQAACPHAVLLELPGVGHSPPYEAPEQTARALESLPGASERRMEARKKVMAFTAVRRQPEGTLLGYLGNLTLNGALVIGEKPLPVDERLTLDLEWPETPAHHLLLEARVARCAPDPENPREFHIGFAFLQVSQEQAQAIQSLLERYHFRHQE